MGNCLTVGPNEALVVSGRFCFLNGSELTEPLTSAVMLITQLTDANGYLVNKTTVFLILTVV